MTVRRKEERRRSTTAATMASRRNLEIEHHIRGNRKDAPSSKRTTLKSNSGGHENACRGIEVLLFVNILNPESNHITYSLLYLFRPDESGVHR